MASIKNLFGKAINATEAVLSVTDILTDTTAVVVDYVSEFREKRELEKDNRMSEFHQQLKINKAEADLNYTEKAVRLQLRKEQMLGIGDAQAALERFEKEHSSN